MPSIPTRTRLLILFSAIATLPHCSGPNPRNDVAGWWYDGQPEGFEDQSIGGGGRPRQVPTNSTMSNSRK